jgi:hypothetical protein
LRCRVAQVMEVGVVAATETLAVDQAPPPVLLLLPLRPALPPPLASHHRQLGTASTVGQVYRMVLPAMPTPQARVRLVPSRGPQSMPTMYA